MVSIILTLQGSYEDWRCNIFPGYFLPYTKLSTWQLKKYALKIVCFLVELKQSIIKSYGKKMVWEK